MGERLALFFVVMLLRNRSCTWTITSKFNVCKKAASRRRPRRALDTCSRVRWSPALLLKLITAMLQIKVLFNEITFAACEDSGDDRRPHCFLA